MNSLGDMAQAFASSRHNYEIKTRLFKLSNELSTGRKDDLSAHLRGDTKRLSDIDRRITVGNAQLATAKAVSQQFDVMQLALGRVNTAREGLASALGTLSLESNPQETAMAADNGRAAFESIVSALNTRMADQALFAGTQTDGRALADPADMLADLSATIAGLATKTDVMTAITDWFNQPGGGFETLGYLGDTGAYATRRIDDETSVEIDIRADDPAIRQLLTATAFAALAADQGTFLSDGDRGALLDEANLALISAASPMVQLQADLGALEGRVEQANAGLSAQLSALSLMRNEMVSADPFETASELEQVQTKLETHYTVTARLSRLSLAEYLR